MTTSKSNNPTPAKAHEGLRLALPSDGALFEPTLVFMQACGLPVSRPSTRHYTGRIPSVDGVSVIFQRSADITQKVEENTADFGITGIDRYLEYQREDGHAVVIIDDLGFGECELVVAVPESWLDIASIDDLKELSSEFRQKGRQLRVATKYPRLVRRFLMREGLVFYSLVHSSGSLEAAPAAGYADIIVDIASSGTTLRENRLKVIEGGVILSSQACLMANVASFREDGDLLEMARAVLEPMEANLLARQFYRVTANIRGPSTDEIARRVLSNPELAGLKGPTIAPVYNPREEDWFAVSMLVPRERLLEAVDHLRRCGGADIAASQADYLFTAKCAAYERLIQAVEAKRA